MSQTDPTNRGAAPLASGSEAMEVSLAEFRRLCGLVRGSDVRRLFRAIEKLGPDELRAIVFSLVVERVNAERAAR